MASLTVAHSFSKFSFPLLAHITWVRKLTRERKISYAFLTCLGHIWSVSLFLFQTHGSRNSLEYNPPPWTPQSHTHAHSVGNYLQLLPQILENVTLPYQWNEFHRFFQRNRTPLNYLRTNRVLFYGSEHYRTTLDTAVVGISPGHLKTNAPTERECIAISERNPFTWHRW